MNSAETYAIQTLPANSAWARELCERGVRKHYIKSLVELDVTAGRKTIRAYKRNTGCNLSFFAWMIKCIADTIDQNRAVQAFRYKRQRVLVFDDVDVSIPALYCSRFSLHYQGFSRTLFGTDSIETHSFKKESWVP